MTQTQLGHFTTFKRIFIVFLFLLLAVSFCSGAWRREVYDYQGSWARQKINYSLFDATNFTGTRANFTGNVSASTGFFNYLGSILKEITKLWVIDIGSSGNINVAGNVTTSSYFKGQPIDGSIGSGVINASKHKTDGTVNVTDEGVLDVDYPDLEVRIWNLDGSLTYCNLVGGTETVTDNAHTVYYVDSTCTLQSATWANYFAQNVNPTNYKRIFDVYAKGGDIEQLHGASIEGINTRAIKWLNINCGGGGHLGICSGIDVQENTFPYFNQTVGSFRYANTEHSTLLRNTETNGIHIVVASDSSHTADTGINLTACDDGAGLAICSTNKYRRYVIYNIGDNARTQIHQLAPVDAETYTNLANCMSIVKFPISYTLPSDENGAAVVHHIYCGLRDASDWVAGWIDIRIGKEGFGATVATDDFMRYSGWAKNADANSFNLTGLEFINALDWSNVTIDGSQISNPNTYNATYAAYAYNVSLNYTQRVYDNWNTDWLSTYNATYALYNNTDMILSVNTTPNIQNLLNATGIYSTYNVTYHNYALNVSRNYTKITYDLWDGRWYQILWDATFNSSFDDRDSDTIFTPTNVAWINESNVFALDQTFSGDILMTDDDYIGISGAERIQFDSDGDDIEIMGGNVGIGTASPGAIKDSAAIAKLQVGDGTANTYISVKAGTNQEANIAFEDDAISTRIGIFGTVSDIFGIYDNTASAFRMAIDTSGNVGIGTTNPTYPLTVVGNVSGISIWSDGNVSATDYMTRTSIFDTSKNVWDYIKDASYYLDNGLIDHTKFYGYAGEFNITDLSRPEEQEVVNEVCEDVFDSKTNETTQECRNETSIITTYPYQKEEASISLNREIDLLRQGIWELKQENNMLKTELCARDPTYFWCPAQYYCSTDPERIEMCVCLSESKITCYYETCGQSPYGRCTDGQWILVK